MFESDNLDKRIDEAEALRGPNEAAFIERRKIGFLSATAAYQEEYAEYDKARLEELRFEHKNKLKQIIQEIERLEDKYDSYYLVKYYATYSYIVGGVSILAGSFLSSEARHLLAAVVATVIIFAMLLRGVMSRWMEKAAMELGDQYELYGISEGMISLSDYRHLETFDLSRLPAFRRASEELSW